MSGTKHTPGPWRISEDGRTLVPTYDPTAPIRGCVVRRMTSANAKLIAAAPDLLAACEAFVTSDVSDTTKEIWEAMRSAIAKATSGK